MSTPLRIKRGATFSYGGLVTLPAGTWGAACSLRAADDALAATLTVTLDPLAEPGPAGETHSILLVCPAATTAAWPLGMLAGDILFTDAAGVAIPSENFSVNVEQGPTRAA